MRTQRSTVRKTYGHRCGARWRLQFVGVALLVQATAAWGAVTNGEGLREAQAEPTAEVERVSLDYKDASLSSVLRSLAKTYDLNLVVTKDLTGTVNISLHEVTLDEALEAILIVNGYTFTRKANLIYITAGPGLEGVGIVTKSILMHFLLAGEAERLLNSSLSSKGHIEVNEATNSLVITDYPSKIAQIRTLLKEIDIAPIQVLIEAKILDVQSKALENFGTTFSVTYNPAGSPQGLFKRNTDFDESIVGTTSFAGPSSTITTTEMTLTTVLKNLTVAATIDLLIQNEKAHLLASPSIATLSGKEARIIIGEKFPYKEQTQTTTGTTETTKFIDVGITLRVTPRVSPDGWITMAVHPEVSSVSATLDAGPRITTREADATVRVRDGETIIIGGLISKQEDRIRSGIPFLRSIPIVGLVFSKRSQDVVEKELAVFLTPKIITSPEDIANRTDIVQEEARLSIDTVASISLAEKLFQQARELEQATKPIASDKRQTHVRQQLLNVYQQIHHMFPNSPHADEALYRVGRLYYDEFAQYQAAANTFQRLITEYPSSRYRRRAYTYLRKSLRRQERAVRRLERLDRQQPLAAFNDTD